MQARIIAHKAVRIAGVEIPAGGIFATMEFDNVLLAEFFAAKLGWSWFRVDLGAVDVVVGAESPDALPNVAELFLGKSPDEAKSLVGQFKSIGITSIATLATADAKALRKIVGPIAGELTRAAKRHMITARHIALGGKPPEAPAKPAASEPATPAPAAAPVPSDPPKSKKPKSKKS